MPKTAKILIIDDDAEIRRLLDEELHDLGHQAIHAADGLQALLLAQRERPDLILLDLALPGADGFAVLERLRALPESTIPVIVFTGSRSPTAEEQARLLGAREFVKKSFFGTDLAEAIDRTLTPKRATDAAPVDTGQSEPSSELPPSRPPASA